MMMMLNGKRELIVYYKYKYPLLVISCAFIICFWIFSITTVAAGHVGVVVWFGHVSEGVLESGLHYINPLASVKDISVRTQILPYDCTVPSSEGLMIKLQLALQYSVKKKMVSKLYKNVGDDYRNIIILPVLSATVREVTSKRDAKALYTSTSRVAMHRELFESMKESMFKYGIEIDDVLLRNVALPENLKEAIENKLKMEQESERMQFVLSKEKQEAERKEIEANGIQKFQEIVSKGIDDHLLKWKGIEATLHLAESQNSKIVIIGSNENGGLPIIFNE